MRGESQCTESGNILRTLDLMDADLNTTLQQERPTAFHAGLCSPVAMQVRRQGRLFLRFLPHGYEYPLELPVITSGSRDAANAWTWNGDIEKPTLRPSIRTNHGGSGLVSHLWLNDGQCQHLADSTDGLAGQTLPLRPLGWQCDHGDEGKDHDWREMEESSGEVDGLHGDHWKWLECRACGARDDEENVESCHGRD